MASFLTRRSLLVAATAASLLVAACDMIGSAPAAFKSIDISGADYGRDWSMPDLDGKSRTLTDFAGKVTVIFFGYTQCPDVCPATLAELAAVKAALGPDGDRVQGVFVTVDPERDTPEILRAYVDAFGGGFVALRGDAEQTLAVAKAFKVYFAKAPGATETSYTMDHTAGSYVFDAKGQLRLFARYGSGADALTHDLRILLKSS